MTSLNDQYRELLAQLCNRVEPAPTVEYLQNRRTGVGVRRLTTGVCLSIDHSQGMIVPRWRRLSPHIPLADTLWQLMGTVDLTWLNHWAPQIWAPYADKHNHLPKAYGVRWSVGLDQAIEHLNHDPTSRQVYVSTWNHQVDMPPQPQSPMPPCILGFQLQTDSQVRLLMTVFQRSADAMVGLPHDLMNFSCLAHLLANELTLPVGSLRFLISDLHLYDQQVPTAETILDTEWSDPLYLNLDPEWTRHTVTSPKVADEIVSAARDLMQPRLQTIPWYNPPVPR